MRGAKLHAEIWLAHGGISICPALRFACTALAALVVGFAVGLRVVPAISVSETTQPKNFDSVQDAHGSQTPNSWGWRLASLDAQAYFPSGTEDPNSQPQSATSVADRFSLAAESFQPTSREISFDERFGALFSFSSSRPMDDTEVRAYSTLALLPHPGPGAHAADHPAVGRNGRGATQLASLSPAGISKKQLTDAPEDANPPLEEDGHTAIYDISAHKVYLPNGRVMEAHSGIGKRLDDPRYVRDKDLGPTPPNVYDLSLREEPFHGVQAIRLVPVGRGNMFGRDGMLAHSYMLGPNGQSNGCVSFSDYDAFLRAYQSGEVSRLVVVEHLDSAPSSKTVAARIAETLKALF